MHAVRTRRESVLEPSISPGEQWRSNRSRGSAQHRAAQLRRGLQIPYDEAEAARRSRRDARGDAQPRARALLQEVRVFIRGRFFRADWPEVHGLSGRMAPRR